MPKATLINDAGQKVVVESGTPQAQQYFGQGYKLMGAPATPAPVVTENKPDPTPVRTISDVAASLPDYTEDPFYSKIGTDYKIKAEETVDQEAIRKAARDRIQSEIDSINLVYNQKLASAKQQGIGRLGSGRATQARSGLLGSDFAAAQNNEIENYNTEILNTIEAERMAKISALTTQAEKDASAEIAEKRKAIEAGADKYLEFLGAQQERKQSKLGGLVQMMLDQGVDPTELTPEQLTKITSSYSTDLNTINSLYKNAQAAKTKADSEAAKTKLETEKLTQDIAKSKSEVKLAEEAAANKDKFFELSEGQTRYVYDPATGEAKVVASRAKTYKGTGTGSGGGGGGVAITADGTLVSYDDPEYTLKTIRSSKGGKELTGEQSKPINKAMQAITQMTDLQSALGSDWESQVGPIIGTLRSANPWDVKAAEIKGRLSALLPNMARGVYGEVGVLTDQDIENYSKTLLNLKSPAEVNKVLLAASNKAALNSLETSLQTMAASGRDVSRFEPIFTGVKGKVETNIGSLKGSAEAAAASNAATVKVKNPSTGAVVIIPAANLQKALEKGYIQVN